MEKKILFIVIIAFLFAIPFVHAGTVVTVTDSVNANGSIGLYIKNELGVTMQFDNTRSSTGVLNFEVNGSNVTINAERSDVDLPKDRTKFVVLNKEWPASGYYVIDVTYKDPGGGLYPKESYILFAKPPLGLSSYATNPAKVISNYSRVTFAGKLSGTGDSDVSSINFQLISNPKYYILTDSRVPGSLAKGATTDVQLTFERDGQSLSDTIVYTTVYVPMKFTYKTMGGLEGTQTFNASYVIFNSLTSTAQIPKMNANIEIPASAEPGQKVAIPVYIWNSNVGGNPACNLNLTLASNSSDLAIPTSIISPTGEFKGRLEQSEDPTTTFTVEVSNATKSGSYKLTLTVNYVDCAWKTTDFFAYSEDISIAKAGEPVIVEKPIPEENKTTKAPIVNITTTKEEPKGIPSIFITILAIAGVVILFGLVYFLEFRSRAIY